MQATRNKANMQPVVQHVRYRGTNREVKQATAVNKLHQCLLHNVTIIVREYVFYVF